MKSPIQPQMVANVQKKPMKFLNPFAAGGSPLTNKIVWR